MRPKDVMTIYLDVVDGGRAHQMIKLILDVESVAKKEADINCNSSTVVLTNR